MRGKVKWFNNTKGYGFIENPDGEDIFIHYSSILSEGYKTLVEGQYVEFELVRTDKGLQAKNVVEIRNLVEDMEATFVLPRDWKDYLYEVEKNHNIIVKTKDSFYCTNCQQTFSCNAKVKNLHKCPCCKKKLEVRTNRLKNLKYKDNIIILDNCNGSLIVRLFELKSEYKADKQEFEHSTVEYARKAKRVGDGESLV